MLGEQVKSLEDVRTINCLVRTYTRGCKANGFTGCSLSLQERTRKPAATVKLIRWGRCFQRMGCGLRRVSTFQTPSLPQQTTPLPSNRYRSHLAATLDTLCKSLSALCLRHTRHRSRELLEAETSERHRLAAAPRRLTRSSANPDTQGLFRSSSASS